jgi:hypothetical protein
LALSCGELESPPGATVVVPSTLVLMNRSKHENLLPLGLTPGPKAPKDLDSFITPFREELGALQNGVKAYDSLTKSEFTLKGHLVLITGDTPAISKLLHLSGHNAIYPCRACTLQGTLYRYTKSKVQNKKNVVTNHAMNYYPPRPAERRTFESYKRDGQQNVDDPPSAKQSNVMGVTAVSPFASLNAISIPDCSPFDVMHLVFLGFTRDLCRLLNGTYFTVPRSDLEGVQMPTKEWEAVGNGMAKAQAPISWGRYHSPLVETLLTSHQ